MLRLVGVCKEYSLPNGVTHALSGINAAFRKCGLVALLGPSGSGKTTLLRIIGGAEQPTAGEAVLPGPTAYMQSRGNLLPGLTLWENLRLKMSFAGVPKGERRKRAGEALAFTGLSGLEKEKTEKLSPLQQQQGAVALALACNAEILLADEPAGALDFESGYRLLELLKKVAKDRLVIVATDNTEGARPFADRILTLADGRIESDSEPTSLHTVNAAGQGTAKPARRMTAFPFRCAWALAVRDPGSIAARTLPTALIETLYLITLPVCERIFSSGIKRYAAYLAVLMLLITGALIGYSAALAIRERRGDIAALTLMGASKYMACTIVAFESILVGCVSGAAGAAAAAAFNPQSPGVPAAVFAAGLILAWTASRIAILFQSRARLNAPDHD